MICNFDGCSIKGVGRIVLNLLEVKILEDGVVVLFGKLVDYLSFKVWFFLCFNIFFLLNYDYINL